MGTRTWAASALAYTVIAAVLGRDVLAQLGTTIANDPGDPLLTAAILHWNAHHVPWTDAWWQFPIYHPTRDTLAFSEHLLGLSLIATPIAWLTGSPLATYNLTLLLTFPLCGMAMFALVHHLTRSPAGAFVAGLAYAFAPYRIAGLPHIQMLASFWAPLALLGLHRFIEADAWRGGPTGLPSPANPQAGSAPHEHGSDGAGAAAPSTPHAAPGGRWRREGAAAGPWRWLALFGVCWALQAASNWYTLVLFSVFVGLWVLWFVIVPRRWRALGAIAAAAGVAALPLAPIAYRYVTVHRVHGFERSVVEMRAFSADVAALLCATPTLTVWGWIDVFCRAEGELFPGVAAIALFAAAIVVALRPGPAAPVRQSGRLGRALRVLPAALLAVSAIYIVVLVSVVVIGPWRMPLLGISATGTDKPLLVALAAAVLALLAAIAPHAWRRPASAMSFYVFGAVVMWLLALGPTITLLGELSGRPGPFALLQWLPGVSGLRVPARFWLMAVLCLAVVAGYITSHLVARRRRVPSAAVVSLVAAALLADGWMAGIPARRPPAPLPDAATLRDQVVLHLPVEPYPDIAATWRAATGGWRSVNGYSGYGPNYYTALSVAAQTADATMFAPFRRDRDLYVVVDDGDGKMRALIESQPGSALQFQGGGFAHYRLPRSPQPAPRVHLRALPIARVESSCARETVVFASDRDERTRWECLQDAERHGLVADLGEARAVSAIVYSVGPYAWNVPTQLAVETSLDGTAWQTVSSGSVLGAFIEGGLDDPAALRATVSFADHPARYVRVRPIDQKEDFGWFVSELEVRGP